MTNSIDDAKNGSETAIKKFTDLGVSLSDLKSLSREEIFDKAVQGLQNITDDTTKAALANDIFGKSGQNIMPLLNATADSTQNLKDNAHELGMVNYQIIDVYKKSYLTAMTRPQKVRPKI